MRVLEKINGPLLYNKGGSPAEYGAGMKLAIARGWLWMHESGTYVKFTPAGSTPAPTQTTEAAAPILAPAFAGAHGQRRWVVEKH
jgi:hypothetical protein